MRCFARSAGVIRVFSPRAVRGTGPALRARPKAATSPSWATGRRRTALPPTRRRRGSGRRRADRGVSADALASIGSRAVGGDRRRRAARPRSRQESPARLGARDARRRARRTARGDGGRRAEDSPSVPSVLLGAGSRARGSAELEASPGVPHRPARGRGVGPSSPRGLTSPSDRRAPRYPASTPRQSSTWPPSRGGAA